jgi:hypothetical protein
MPAYNFKKQFAPKVESGEKRQTIRRPRKRRTRLGDALYLYTGMRTKYCRKLRTETCKSVIPISIQANGIYVGLCRRKLSMAECKKIAIADGFESLSDFMDFFESQGLPYHGELIKW